eukprot:TRINITY_DN2536_c0_g1_i1.p1 TRINITY_DN2536_c0_g1~~TRINITY_DN2536_c0_g1_i1.p1  ORF type:complete len:167 (-),score=24.65 TRINITY_DN2536_c0_g1_i1:105-605(-)
MIVMIDIELFGLSTLLGMKFEFFFSLAILLALGITVDFNIHIVHRALELLDDDSIENEWERRVDHTRKVLMSVGSSVFHGTFSTLIVCLTPIFFVPIAFLQRFYGQLCMIMIFGMFHGLVVLPVILTLFPISHAHTQEVALKRANSKSGLGVDLPAITVQEKEEND